MDFRIQNKSTGTPIPLSYNNNHSPPSKQDLPRTHHHHHQNHTAQVSSFTPSPTIDDAPNQRPRRDSDLPDPTRIPAVVDAPAAAAATTKIRYLECLKNHAAHMGNHVVDGCGEFMADGEESDHHSGAAALVCAACGCHRNFHRKETQGDDHHSIVSSLPNYNKHGPQFTPINKNAGAGYSTAAAATTQLHNPSPLQHTPMSIGHHHHFPPPPPTMMTFGDHRHSGGSAATESSSEDLNLSAPEYGGTGFRSSSSSKKRYRTKFTQAQKDKMMEFAQRIGWKIQKLDEVEVQQFCAEVGVKRKVFKVWMHNNKQAMKRRDS